MYRVKPLLTLAGDGCHLSTAIPQLCRLDVDIELLLDIIVFRSPIGDVKVISVGSLLETDSTAYVCLFYLFLDASQRGVLFHLKYFRIVWRGPRKTALIKRFLKDTFFGRLDCLIVG